LSNKAIHDSVARQTERILSNIKTIRNTVAVAGLDDNLDVEIEVIAAVG